MTRRPTRHPFTLAASAMVLGLAIPAAAILDFADSAAWAEPNAGHRTRERASHASVARTAPDVTGSIRRAPSPDPVVKPLTPPPEAPLGPPIKLPTASRARIRACGEEWQARKTNGQAGTDIWRDFAMVCLAQPTPPSPERSSAAR